MKLFSRNDQGSLLHLPYTAPLMGSLWEEGHGASSLGIHTSKEKTAVIGTIPMNDKTGEEQ